MSLEILTFGCRLNAYESEVIRTHAAGLEGTVVVNTCAVTAEAERQACQAIRRIRRANPEARIVVTGCAVQRDPSLWAALPGVARVLGNAEKLDPRFWRADSGSAVADIMTAKGPPAPTLESFAGRARAFVQIQQGCDHRCTFCVIPYGRGPSRSVSPEAVLAQARSLLTAGYRELVLTGVDLTAYGADLPGHPPLGRLVGDLLAALPELPRLRLSSLDPEEIDEELWRLIAEEKRLMPHLHLSLQSGSDLILKRMKRRHSRAGALATIARARTARPGIALGADLIAGFPTETEKEAAETEAFVAEAAIPYLHVFPFSPRPGTPAARMPPVPPAERRARAARLRAAGASNLARFLAALDGKETTVLVEAEGRGHSEHFAPVRLAKAARAGALVRVRLAAASDYLIGTPI